MPLFDGNQKQKFKNPAVFVEPRITLQPEMSLDVQQELENRVRKYLSGYDSSHDYSHIQRVMFNARRLIQGERSRIESEAIQCPEIDEQIVIAAVMVHDVGDFKYTKDLSIQREHLLQVLDGLLQPEALKFVTDIVMHMSFRKELEQFRHPVKDRIEFQIVQDADRLDAIGAVGLARCFVYSGATGRPIICEEALQNFVGFQSYYAKKELTASEYNQATLDNRGDAISHVFEKLLTLKDRMKTDTGKSIAAQRHQFMISFLEQFKVELKANE